MGSKFKVLVLLAITALILALPVSGQQHYKEEPFDAPQSNQIQATAGVFGTDVDDYLDVNYWSDVVFGKWFGYVTGGSYEATNSQWPFAIDLGYATKIGAGSKGIYLGTRYVGNILQITGDSDPAKSTNSIEVEYPNPATGWNPNKVTTTTEYGEGWYNSTNQIDVLIGLSNMGFKVGFFESITTNKFDAPDGHTFTKTVDYSDGSITYDNKVDKYVETQGHIIPSLGFGINLGVGNALAIKPYVGLAFDIFKDNKIVNINEQYTVFEGTTTLGSEDITYEGYNNGYMLPSITIGATLEFPSKESTDMSVGLEYGFGIGLFSNDYDAGVTGSAGGDVKWTNGRRTIDKYIDRTETTQTSELDFVDRSYMSHAITPSFLITKEISGLKLGFKAELPVSMTFASEDSYSEIRRITETKYDLTINQQDDKTRTEVEKKYGGLKDISVYNIAPVLGIGASYQLIPNRFSVNAGVRVIPVNFTRKITKTSPNGENKDFITEVDGYGNTTHYEINNTIAYPETKTDSVVVEDILASFSGNITGGFVFSFNENFALDLLAGVNLNSSGVGSNYDNSDPPNHIGDFTSSGANDGTNGFNINVTTVKVLFTFKF